MVKRVCSQCPEPYLAKGLCRKHYNASRYLADRSHQRELGKAWSAAHRDYLREYHANRRQSPDTRAHVFGARRQEPGAQARGEEIYPKLF